MSKLTLAEWRRAKNYSQKQLAEAVGVHVNTIIRWEASPEKINLGDAMKIVDFLNLTIDDVDFSCPQTPSKMEQSEVELDSEE